MYADFESLKKDCAACKKCPLGETRTNLVFGVGNERAEVMFIGEGPGYNEDMQGEAVSSSINFSNISTLTGIKTFI